MDNIFPDGKPRWEGYKKKGVNHGSFTMWYDNGRKRMKGVFKMVLNMDYPLRGIKMESSGSKDLITLVIPSEHGNHGMKKVNSCRNEVFYAEISEQRFKSHQRLISL